MAKLDLEQSSGTSEVNDKSAQVKPSRIQRWKAHMQKWWWLYLICFCAIVLVVVLPIIYVGVPRIASQYINDYKYDYTGLQITNPRPSAFHVSQTQKLKMGGGFSGSGHLSAFNATITVPGTSTPMAIFPVSQIDFSDGADFSISQDLDLLCVDCLSQLAAAAASDKEYAVLVTGDPDLKFGALPTAHLDIHKTMKMQGYNVQEFLNSDGAFNVTSLDLLSPTTPEGYNVNATVAFHNPTPFSVEMGFVSLNLSVGDTSLGYVDLPNLTIEGDIVNTVVLGSIDETLLIKKGLWESSNTDFGKVNIDIHGNRCEYGGQEIPYFTAAIRAINASAKIDLMDYVGDIL
ncbi:DUF3712 domain-containing protein [Aspergillus clavatus NRRL 1]|uniref:Uncharacterized protein n=1 Tax=Aspergillus clavatus (strain ATCC 1007 / CBS 513.65 / DSM 816 / NCTC 3887 / NRRL 1 / QM 1276 / 107) TaxID=344612 RepID=A1CR24_ASPCL|nr:uncharacterized protein ACLA_028200 [Aspergillus clavatus NRRL 1]EAW08095.1 conserved hypothetical protein [Aspergillus clavatus NRRL 1]